MTSRIASLLLPAALAGVLVVSLADAAVKAAVVLLVAAIACAAMWRASSASRHLVWLSALCAALAMPALSLCVPQWNVLPNWMSLQPAPDPVTPATPPALPSSAIAAADSPIPTIAADATTVVPNASPVTPHAPSPEVAEIPVAWTIPSIIVSIWLIGACLALLPLVRGLWTIHRLTVSSRTISDGPLLNAASDVARELGTAPPRVLLGPPGTMPMVWGLFRGTLLLPEDAASWAPARLRAVLLHELAHLRRRDPWSLAVAHVSRAVHWFNPLAWIAVRCLRAEQERACDDVVLHRGVQPSDYAEHVLELATCLRTEPAATTLASAMADRSRLESRLRTILDAAANRKTLSRGLAILTLIIVAGVAVSLAMLRAADDKNSQADGKALQQVGKSAQPKDESARRFLKAIRFRQREDGSFPPETLNALRKTIEGFLRSVPKWSQAPAATKWLQDSESKTGWTEAELVSLLDSAATWGETHFINAEYRERDIPKPGRDPEPGELEGITFGPAAKNGLRVAWVLDPAKDPYAIGDVVKCRIVFHNAGQEPVKFVTELLRQHDHWRITDGNQKPIGSRDFFHGGTWHARYHLKPGGIVDVETTALAIGEGEHEALFQSQRVGRVIQVKTGDTVRIQWELSIPGFEHMMIKAKAPDAQPGEWAGTLKSAPVEFKVIDDDPVKPGIEVVTRRGKYRYTKFSELWVSQQTDPFGEVMNGMSLVRFPDERGVPIVPGGAQIPLPPGENSYAVAWDRKTRIVWIAERNLLRRVDLSDLATARSDQWPRAEADKIVELPKAIREALDKALPMIADQDDDPNKPGVKVVTSPGIYKLTKSNELRVRHYTDKYGVVSTYLSFLGFPKGGPWPEGAEPTLQVNGQPAIAWERGTLVLWIAQPKLLKRIDLSDTSNQEKNREWPRSDADKIVELPKAIREALDKALPMNADPDDGAKVEPKSEAAKAFLKAISYRRGEDGAYPLEALQSLRWEIADHVRKYPSWNSAGQMKAWLERGAAMTSWTESGLVEYVDSAATWAPQLLTAAELRERRDSRDVLKPGRNPKSGELDGITFGPAAPNGLRMAWVLDPAKDSYEVGDVVSCRIVFQNSGQEPVKFVTAVLHQHDRWQISDGSGTPIPSRQFLESRPPFYDRYILKPGQIVERETRALAIGDVEDESLLRANGVGRAIHVKPGDTVNLQWEAPVPGLEHLPKADIPAALPGEWAGALQSHRVQFKVVADDSIKPGVQVVTRPGRYKFSKHSEMQVYEVVDRSGHVKHEMKIDWLLKGRQRAVSSGLHGSFGRGKNNYAIAWERGTQVIWAATPRFVWYMDLSDSAKLKGDMWPRAEFDRIAQLPKTIREALLEHLPMLESEPDDPADDPKSAAGKAFLKAIEFRRNKDGTYPQMALKSLREQIERQLKEEPAGKDAAAMKAWLEETANVEWFLRGSLSSLVDDAARWSTPVVSWAEQSERSTIRPGKAAKPEDLKDLAFGEPAENGLRVAWVFDPNKETYSLGEVLKCRVVFHNAGKQPVQFVTHTWRQDDTWNVKNAEGQKVEAKGVWYTGITPYQRVRLEPGQTFEVTGHGVGIGEGKYEEEFSHGQIGQVIHAKAGDELRVNWDLRLPGFESRDATGSKTVPGPEDWSGSLSTGEVKFRVVAPDPDAKAGAGLATGPGRSVLNDATRLQVTRVTHPDGKFTNSANIQWFADGNTDGQPAKLHPLKLPDGLKSFAIVWERGRTTLWIVEAATVRRVQFASPQEVQETPFERAKGLEAAGMPKAIQDELQKQAEVLPAAESRDANPAPKPAEMGENAKPGGPVVAWLDLSTAPKLAASATEI